MERRNFLKGLMTTTAAGLLVRADTPGVEAFAPAAEEPVVVSRATTAQVPLIDTGLLVFDAYGVPLGVIEEMRVDYESYDVATWGDTHARFVRGMPRCRLTVVTSGPVQVRRG